MFNFVWVDYAILIAMVISTGMSFRRGLAKEAFSLIAWFLAFVVSSRFYEQVMPHLSAIEQLSLRKVAAIAVLFVGTLVAGALLGRLLRQVLATVGLSSTDKILGACFGALRGTLMITAAIFIADIFEVFKNASWWSQSVFIPQFKEVVEWFYQTMAVSSGFR